MKPENRNGPTLLRKRKRKLPSSFTPPKALVIYAKINGKPDTCSRVVGWTIDEFLTNCTQILRLTSAARKIYLNDGTLVDSIDQLKNNPEVFVSQGEPFIDTTKLLKETITVREMSFWGLNGLYLPKLKPKHSNSSRENEQSNKMRRVLAFVNGEYFLSSAFELISDLKNFEEFLALCDYKHCFNGHCKRIFSVDCTEIKDLSRLISDQSYVWNPNSEISSLGPVWVSARDDIDVSAIYQYFHHVTDAIKQSLAKERKHLSELNAMTNGDLENVHTSSIKSYSKKELDVRRNDCEDKVRKLENDRDKFQSHLDTLSEGSVKETDTEHRSSANSHFKSAQGLRIKVYTNGQPKKNEIVFFFNVEQAKKGINDSTLLFNRLLDELSKNIYLTKANDHSRGILVRRLFTVDGVEIKDLSELTYDQTVCVSHGENWIDPKCLCLSGRLHFMNEDLVEWSNDLAGLKNYDISRKMSEKQLIFNLPVLQNQKESRNYLMVSLAVTERTPGQALTDTWSFTKSGRIYLRRVPSLSLTLFEDSRMKIKFRETSSKPNGKEQSSEMICYTVQLFPIKASNPYQLWEYTPAGHLSCKAIPSLLLTYIPTRTVAVHDSFFDIVTNANICATELLPEPLDAKQRWGFKHFDEWKMCDLPNLEWHKAKFIWPYKQDGSFNDDLKWPLEANMIANAPTTTKYNVFSDTRFPIKLNVLKNNDHRNNKAVLVTGPDLTKLVRIHRQDKYETHCSNESLLRQEFEMFLSNCTGSLALPSAARRVFVNDGKELTTLEGLSNYDYVCVSMGEMWCSPEKSLTKIQLRSYANKLAIDVERLKNFISLHHSNKDLLLGVKCNILEEDATLEVQLMNELSRNELQRLYDEDHRIPISEPVKEPSEDENAKYKTIHERNCDAAKLRYAKTTDVSQPVPAINVTSAKGMKKSTEALPCVNLQQFTYENQFIMVSSDPKYYMCANGVGKPVSFKRIRPMTDTSQCKWLLHKYGVIESLYYRGFVLTVACPRMLPFQDRSIGDYIGATITLEKAINTKYGNSLQHFNIASMGGFIYPFYTNENDQGVTSAILSSICTRFVSSQPINQQGYMVEMKKSANSVVKSFPICLSCVTILNGRFPITPIDDCRFSFTCSYSGGFKVIRNVDLSSEKAVDTYQLYLAKLHKVREQLVIKPCKNRITATPISNIRVLLYRNGLGRTNTPQLVTGKTINQIMEMATNAFNLQRPVRILYTENGGAIVDDLSFINIMYNPTVTDDIQQQTNDHVINDVTEVDTTSAEEDETLTVTLSDDGSYFIVQLGDKIPVTLYCIEIFISSVFGINRFQKEDDTSNLYFLINYEIFNNQINTDLFGSDSDFESEVTELTVKSSKAALQRLFNEDLSVLRMQVISVSVDNAHSEDMKLDIKSINAIADVDLKKIAQAIPNLSKETVTKTILCPLISTESFGSTSASLTVEVSLKMMDVISDQRPDEIQSVESESIIAQPLYVPDNHPIELWASIGEPFSFPSETASKSPRRTMMDQLKTEKSNKKYLLRNIKGDRINKLYAGTLEATGDAKNPVMIKGNWMFPSKQESELECQIEILEKQISEQKPRAPSHHTANVSRSLYIQKHMKNCLVYRNGDKEANAISVWGETVYDIMHNAAAFLKMKKKPKFLFKSDGFKVESIEEISPDMRLALSHHSTFISSEDVRLQCEIKANWGRARSKHGEKSTEIQVRHRPITVIDVDPFEPPDVMKPPESISKDFKTFSVFENGQPSSGALMVKGNSFSDVLKQAAVVLGLSAPVKCFYTLEGKRIINFKEILNDDILAASVTGKGFVKNEDD